MRRGRLAERIEVGLDVADRAVGVDEVVDVRLLEAVDDRGGGVSLASIAAAGEAATGEPPLEPRVKPWKKARHVGSTELGFSATPRTPPR